VADTPLRQRLDLARQHHAAGRLAQAEALYRGLLREDPGQADALYLLGVLTHHAGRPAEAVGLLRRALEAGPHAACHVALAAAWLALDRPGETEAHAREAVRLEPNSPDGHYHLAMGLLAQERLADAEPAFRETLRLRPGDLEARCHLATLLRRLGRAAEAFDLLAETIDRAPSHARARNCMGAVLLNLGQLAAAETHLREAARLAPGVAEVHNNLGQALWGQQQSAGAEACFREAVRLKPTHVKAHNNLAFVLVATGRPDEARAEFQASLQLDPANSWALIGLSRLVASRRHALTDEELRRVEELADEAARPPDDRSRYHFTLARAREQAGAYDRAFAHFRRANELLLESLRAHNAAPDPAVAAALVRRLVAACTPDYFRRVRGFGRDSELPVFIVGMPRSGTTLAEQILGNHPQAFAAGELSDVNDMANALPGRLGGVLYPECLGSLDGATAAALADEHLGRLRRRAGGAVLRVVDKMPHNYLHLGLIAALFPRARVVHCRRDPIDTCLSCYVQDFARQLPCGPDLAALGAHYRDYERLMAHLAPLLPLPVFELRYEELTADPEGVSRRLVAFCGLDWDDRCLRFHETRRAVATASALQVREPVHRRSVGRWKRYEAHLGPLFHALGLDGVGTREPRDAP
jgi:tetratricopeptide (TPR) repeat protein